MKYIQLKNLYYADKNAYEKAYVERYQGIGTIKLPIKIKKHPAFIANTKELTILTESIFRKAMRINEYDFLLPDVAKSFRERSCLIDEIQMSNDIEGVNSSKAEISEALTNTKSKKELRFSGIANKYVKILNNEKDLSEDIYSISGIRKLYDEIFLNEIPLDDRPDGLFFRTNKVFVRNPRQKIIHAGLTPESEIISNMEKSISMLQNEEIPYLYRVAAFHYCFGYIHPFYDGNGRMGRFMSSALFAHVLPPLMSIRLSYVIKKKKDQYYKAFEDVNDSKNRGDVTPFVLKFLSFVDEAADTLLDRIEQQVAALNEILTVINLLHDDGVLKKREGDIMFLLAQNYLFADEPFSMKELSETLKVSWSTEKASIDEIIRKGFPVTVSQEGKTKRIRLNVKGFLDEYREKYE